MRILFRAAAVLAAVSVAHAIGDVKDEGSPNKRHRVVDNSAESSNIDEIINRFVSWEDALIRFESSPTESLDDWEPDSTFPGFLSDVIILNTAPKSMRQIVLEELINEGIRVPAESIQLRLIAENHIESWTIEEIQAMRRSILYLLLHPVWFHEYLRAQKTELDDRKRKVIVATLRSHEVQLPSRYLDAEFVDRSIILWNRYCLSMLKIEISDPPCKFRTIHSAFDGRPIDGWTLSNEMQKAALVDELEWERTKSLVSHY